MIIDKNYVAPKLFLFFISVAAVSGVSARGQVSERPWHVLIDEAHARKSALTTALPSFPREVVDQGFRGVVRVKIAINQQGEVPIIKFKPGTNPLIKEAVVDAVRQWRFKPYPDRQGLNRYGISRLSFRFSITEAGGHVELYTPPADAPDYGRLGFLSSGRELREWNSWDEVVVER